MKSKIKFYTCFLFITLSLYCVQTVYCQQLALSGKITFEKKENLHKQFTEVNSWTEEMLKRLPKYRTDLFQLSFNTHKSLYLLTQEDESPFSNWWKVAANNSVLNHFDTKQYIAEKTIYERKYRIEDSLPQLQWKLLGEYRDIAGYNCRKASTIIMDSLYIIAFYTDEIPISGGPESFNGLPGMILGIVVPRLNLTYFATKVETQLLPETEFVIKATKSKKTDFKSYKDELNKAVKDWGEYASKVMWKAIL
ncbi:MAG: GLPGLI family protein [Bacteroidota bacterium]|nr:GLPGLI family protein [Bacteroidota bacterium]